MASTDLRFFAIKMKFRRQIRMISSRLRYKYSAEKIILLIDKIQATITEILESGVELLPAHRQVQMSMFFGILEQGIELTEKVLRSKWWELRLLLNLDRRMKKLDKEITDFVKSPILDQILTEIHRHKKMSKKLGSMTKNVIEEWEFEYGPLRFSYEELYNFTNGFQEEHILGRGGFGQVYKGELPGSSGPAEIAVKRTSHESRQGMSEFQAEISTIGRLKHRNLVRLLGYCTHKEELFLVYDYMPNGSLDKYISRNGNQERLTWEQCFKIIKDVASGLLYMHQEWKKVIIHRDIKPANVLIDHEMNARLGDFGLAKLCDHGFDPKTSKVAGTFGYMAPEFVRTGRATTSTDVYAFGLVMLEVVCGRRLFERHAEENEEVLVDWIFELWENGEIFNAAEKSIRKEQNKGQIELVLKLGVLCSHITKSIRPDMSVVLQILNGTLQLPGNLLDVLRREKLRGWHERSLILDVNSFGTNSFTSLGR